MMLKRYLALMLLLAAVLAAATALAAESVSFEETAVTLFENEQRTLNVTVSEGLRDGEVRYASGSPKVATVDANGCVTGVSKGTAVITASIKTAKQTYKATVKVTVLRAVESVALNEEGLNVLTEEDGVSFYLAQSLLGDYLPEEMYEDSQSVERIILLINGRKMTAAPVVKPNGASDKTVTVTSSDEAVLTVRKQSLTASQEGASLLTVASVSNPEVTVRYGVLVVSPVTKLTADTVRTTIGVGGTTQVELGFDPEDATFKAVRWTSESPKVATVDENGLVTGVSKGRAVIRATALDGSRKTDSVTVTVQLLPTAVVISGDSAFDLATGKTRDLKAAVQPTNASNTRLTWSSTDPGVARVNQQGRVTAVSLGECDIVAASEADPDIAASVHVTVIQEITSIKFTQRSMDLAVHSTGYAQVDISPANASNPTVTFSSDNTRVATVDAAGLITAVSKGNTTIRAKAADGSGKTASMTLNVVQLPEEITLDKSAVTVYNGRTARITATVLPKNANNRAVTWESTDTAIAKVNAEGQITGVKAGNCQVICRAKADQSVTAVVDVTVHQLVTAITPDVRTVTLNVGESTRIHWTVGPDDATNPAVTLSSSKTGVATIEQDGYLRAIKRGECNIIIKAQDAGGKQATVKVNVLQPVEGVTMRETAVTADVEGTVKLTAILIPSDASNTRMRWQSADESIATVSGSNTKPTVTGHRWGTTQITGITEDGGYKTAAYVTVGNYDTALRPTDLYLENNAVKLSIINVSNLSIARVEFTIECYDIFNVPLACNVNGSNSFDGLYQYPLDEGESTRHGRFNFIDYLQPVDPIGRVVLTITSYRVQSGVQGSWGYDIPTEALAPFEYVSPDYIGFLPPEEGEEEALPEFVVLEEEEQVPPPVG